MSNSLEPFDRFPSADVRLRRALQSLEVKVAALGGLGITAGGLSITTQAPLFVNGSGVGLTIGTGLSVVAGALTATAGTTLAGLTDVSLSSPTNGQVLTYNTVAGKWENATPTTGVTTLAALTDVSVSSITNGQTLTYNSVASKWENVTPTAYVSSVTGSTGVIVSSGLTPNVSLPAGGTNGYVLTWNSGSSTWGPAAPSGGGGGTVTSVTGTSPIISSGSSTTPAISLAGMTGLGTANYLVAMNAGGTGWTYVNPTSVGNAGTVTSVTGTAPISIATGTTTPVVSISTSGASSGNVLTYNGTAWAPAAPSGGSGIASYGQMYVNLGSAQMTPPSAGTYIRVSGGMSAGTLSGVTFQNARELVVPNTGKYFIQWNMSLTSPSTGAQPAGTVMINNVTNVTCTAQSYTALNTTGSQVSGSTILSLNASDVVALGVTNIGGTQGIKVLNASLSILQIG